MAVPLDVPARPPDHEILLQAAGVRVSADGTIDAMLRRAPDWTSLIGRALHHRLAPALLSLLQAADPDLVPRDLLAALRAHCETLRAQSHTVVNELFALLDALALAGVAAIPFKGPLLGELLFGEVGHRSPGDIDLLIRPADTLTVCSVLEDRGYVDVGGRPRAAPLTDVQRRMYERFQCEYQYARVADDLVVEPHWGLSQRPLAIDVDYQGMLDRARPSTLCTRPVRTLAPEDLLVALCVHGSKHRWQRLAWIRDVAAVLAVFPEIDLGRVMGEARRRGYARLMLLSLAVAHRCAAAPLPNQIVHLIESNRKIVSLKEDIVGRLFDVPAEEPRNDRIDGFRLRMRERWSDRAHYAVRTLVTPRRHHLEALALPPFLSWGYYPLKIGIDYAVLPTWHILKWAKVLCSAQIDRFRRLVS